MKIFAHTLFKNSEKWLWYSVTSVIDHVDKLLLWDTGSTDNSWEIAKVLKAKYKDKIDLKQYGEVTSETFPIARQAMLDVTDADWFIVVDDDEIWWKESIQKLIQCIKSTKSIKGVDCIVVPTINLVGDVYHKLPEGAGRYKFGNKVGHYNLRAVRRNIEGLHSAGLHGVWGWADKNGKQIQERNTFEIIDASYLHTTFLPRSNDVKDINNVPKRFKKIKYEIGEEFSKDFYYPEVFFCDKPDLVPSLWQRMDFSFWLKSLVLTPLRKLKRKFVTGKVGY